MATNPMLQAVLLFQHQQATAPFRTSVVPAAARVEEPLEDVEVLVPPPEPEEQHG